MTTPGRGGKRPRFALLDELIGFDLVHVRIVGSRLLFFWRYDESRGFCTLFCSACRGDLPRSQG